VAIAIAGIRFARELEMLSGKMFDLNTGVFNQSVDELPGSATAAIEHHDLQFEQGRRGNERGIRLGDRFSV